MNEFTIKPEIEITVTRKIIDSIIDTAFAGGINYWCNDVRIIGEWKGEYFNDHIINGGALTMYDMESEDVYELTLEKLKRGLILFLESEDVSFEVNEGKLDLANMDACDADSIIQFTLFGELVFC